MQNLFQDHSPGSEEIPTGGWRAVQDVYRTKDGNAYFTFSFVKVGIFFTHYEIDIVSQPSYGDREAGQHSTHRLPSARGGYRVCLGDDSQADSLFNARKWAGTWAEHTWNYICTGRSFPNR
ncbi:MAG: hypothetical protein BWK78_05470 [Thiotrichaceae bacterium IS1]|nr:MAG: hypothetical protein BWK78_05470 [Thiotrichaceae bacterium IS1]